MYQSKRNGDISRLLRGFRPGFERGAYGPWARIACSSGWGRICLAIGTYLALGGCNLIIHADDFVATDADGPVDSGLPGSDGRPPGSDGGLPGSDGGPVVGSADANPACGEWTPVNLDLCMLYEVAPNNGDVLLLAGSHVLFTDIDVFQTSQGSIQGYPLRQGNEVNALLLRVERFEMQQGAKLRVAGTRPLIILSNTTIIIRGEIDLSSPTDSFSNERSGGGGHDPASCSMQANYPAHGSPTNLAGGGGGGFGSSGGSGGNGGPMQGPAGVSVSMTPLAGGIRGGCPGGRGGTFLSGDGSPGGHGGGAIHLAAQDSIEVEVEAVIHAGGGGGVGGSRSADLAGGGGGGGSGGLILLDAPEVHAHAFSRLFANGGGGGGGSTIAGPGQGGTGGNGLSADQPADRGNGPGDGSDGGQGDCRSNGQLGGEPGGSSGSGTAGSGGGGGGVGYILAHTADLVQEPTHVSSPLLIKVNDMGMPENL